MPPANRCGLRRSIDRGQAEPVCKQCMSGPLSCHTSVCRWLDLAVLWRGDEHARLGEWAALLLPEFGEVGEHLTSVPHGFLVRGAVCVRSVTLFGEAHDVMAVFVRPLDQHRVVRSHFVASALPP